MTLNERLPGGNLVHILVLCCFVTFVNFIFSKKKNNNNKKKNKKKSYMPPNHFAGYVF